MLLTILTSNCPQYSIIILGFWNLILPVSVFVNTIWAENEN